MSPVAFASGKRKGSSRIHSCGNFPSSPGPPHVEPFGSCWQFSSAASWAKSATDCLEPFLEETVFLGWQPEHGFASPGTAGALQKRQSATIHLGLDTSARMPHLPPLLLQEDCNVIIVDWRRGARRIYPIAVVKTALVGCQASRLLQRLVKHYPDTLGPELVHVVGFSLGAQHWTLRRLHLLGRQYVSIREMPALLT
ncbi:inactive pancreatic lipase-related protein 1-like isoform X2 [Dermacentor variabilis]|uniref:inactive pancreatic lipase-related protein 1-like isoform X2 n=1 Tax=Dermacentor variabilis TaxID=34621 RepID=UPI003F5B7B13